MKNHLYFGTAIFAAFAAFPLSNPTGFRPNDKEIPSSIDGKNNLYNEMDGKKPHVAKVAAWLKNQPVEFLENKGQIRNTDGKVASNVLFKAEAPGVDLYLTETGLTYVFLEYEKDEEETADHRNEEMGKLKYERVTVNLAGARILKENIIKENASEAYYNFLLGPGDQSIYHLKKYKKVTVKDVYPGIDWVLYNSNASGFKYDFIVHPGADPGQIQLIYLSAKPLQLTSSGNLLLENKTGRLEENAPYTYLQKTEAGVVSSYILTKGEKKAGLYESRVEFQLALYDRSQSLVIDPQLIWSTFYGGNDFDGPQCLDIDKFGNVFICGYTASTNFPLTNAGTYFQSAAFASGFILKFSNIGAIIWSTFFGPGACSYLAVDNNGNLFVTGNTNTAPFPALNAGTYFQTAGGGNSDAFIAKFDNAGNCLWATPYGGSGRDVGTTIATDPNGNVFAVGTTSSTNFPLQNSGGYFEPFMTGTNAAFIVKFDNAGNRQWATYLKGISWPVATSDLNGSIFITGQATGLIPLMNPGGSAYYQGTMASTVEICLLKFDNTANLAWGTYYGGTGFDMGTSIATDRMGNIFVTGITTSTNLPTQNGGPGTYFQGPIITAPPASGNDVFILKFNNTLTRLWATYIGGSRLDNQTENDNLAIDTCGNVFLGLTTISRNVPFQIACDGGLFDNSIDTSVGNAYLNLYLARFSNAGNLMWSTLFGGDANSFRSTMGTDKFGNVFFSGEWNNAVNPNTYPLMWPGGTTYTSGFMGFEDLYVAKFTNNLPLQNFSYPNLCLNDTVLPTLAAGFLPGGLFTSALGLSLNPQSGEINANASIPATYTVTYMMAPCYCPGATAGPVGTTTVSILIASAPVFTILGTPNMCIGDQQTFTATGSNSYTWSPGPATSTISLAPQNISTTVYTITGRDASTGCIAKRTITLTVSKCTGVSEANDGSAILQIFPNPNSGEFTITSDRDGVFMLVNELGQKIRQITFSSQNERKVNMRGLTKGVYLLVDKSGPQKTPQKIVIVE